MMTGVTAAPLHLTNQLTLASHKTAIHFSQIMMLYASYRYSCYKAKQRTHTATVLCTTILIFSWLQIACRLICTTSNHAYLLLFIGTRKLQWCPVTCRLLCYNPRSHIALVCSPSLSPPNNKITRTVLFSKPRVRLTRGAAAL